MRIPFGTGRIPSSYCSSCLVHKAMIFIIQSHICRSKTNPCWDWEDPLQLPHYHSGLIDVLSLLSLVRSFALAAFSAILMLLLGVAGHTLSRLFGSFEARIQGVLDSFLLVQTFPQLAVCARICKSTWLSRCRRCNLNKQFLAIMDNIFYIDMTKTRDVPASL